MLVDVKEAPTRLDVSKLQNKVRRLIQEHRGESVSEIKEKVWRLLEHAGYSRRSPRDRKFLKQMLVEFLVGDRRLKIPSIRKILIEYRNVDQLIIMVLRQFGQGTIGLKALGMEAAYAVLTHPKIREKYDIQMPIHKPRSYYLGSNLLLEFLRLNERTLGKYRRLKYESFEKIMSVQEELEQDFLNAQMPPRVIRYLEYIIDEVHRPIIVRSSSKLEDNPDASFAGKYASYFLANEGSREERLAALERAIKMIWRSVFNPDAIIYRLKMGFLRRDEQMGILLQKVIGRKFDVVYPDPKTGKTCRRRLFAPVFAGVGFSRNLIYILSPRIRQEDGVVRLVIGLGTRAVERNRAYEASLSIPGFFPERDPYRKQKMTQSTMDCLDLQKNEIVHVPASWAAKYSGKFYELVYPFFSVLKDGFLRPLSSQHEIIFEGTPEKREWDNIVIDFHNILSYPKWKGINFPSEMKKMFRALEDAFGYPVDIEFAGTLDEQGRFRFYILQSRAQIFSEALQEVKIPRYKQQDVIIENNICLTTGKTREGSEYLIFVDSAAYKNFPDKQTIARAIGKIVHHPRVQPAGCIAILPGRTGSNNPELGVPVHFSEISELKGLVEYGDEILTTDISYGTHFYSEIRDVNIQFMPVQKNDPQVFFNEAFLKNAPSVTRELLPDAGVEGVIRVIHLTAAFPSQKAYLFMNGLSKKGVLIKR
ncbi:MAG: hypothetical protein GXO78_10490 [Calditrichaeota bacterium]|nr:hypothetical protein [Calditrichota bacterium]